MIWLTIWRLIVIKLADDLLIILPLMRVSVLLGTLLPDLSFLFFWVGWVLFMDLFLLLFVFFLSGDSLDFFRFFHPGFLINIKFLESFFAFLNPFASLLKLLSLHLALTHVEEKIIKTKNHLYISTQRVNILKSLISFTWNFRGKPEGEIH